MPHHDDDRTTHARNPGWMLVQCHRILWSVVSPLCRKKVFPLGKTNHISTLIFVLHSGESRKTNWLFIATPERRKEDGDDSLCVIWHPWILSILFLLLLFFLGGGPTSKINPCPVLPDRRMIWMQNYSQRSHSQWYCSAAYWKKSKVNWFLFLHHFCQAEKKDVEIFVSADEAYAELFF